MTDEQSSWVFIGFAIVAFIVLMVFAIGGEDRLDGTSWSVVELDGQPLIEGTQASMDFDDGGVNGFAGCNSFFGDYDVDGSTLSFGPLGITQAFCDQPPGLADQELEFMALLGQVDSFEESSDTLVLSADGRAVVTLISS